MVSGLGISLHGTLVIYVTGCHCFKDDVQPMTHWQGATPAWHIQVFFFIYSYAALITVASEHFEISGITKIDCVRFSHAVFGAGLVFFGLRVGTAWSDFLITQK